LSVAVSDQTFVADRLKRGKKGIGLIKKKIDKWREIRVSIMLIM
jgi:hypothetical protein